MTNFSLSPIFAGITPIFDKLRFFAGVAMLATPVAFASPIYNAEHTQIKIKQVYQEKNRLSEKEKVLFAQFAQDLGTLIDMINPLIDLATMIAPGAAQIIPDEELKILNGKISEYEVFTNLFINELQKRNIQHPVLVNKLRLSLQKMQSFSEMISAEKYKYQSDETLFSRLYNGENVAYTFNPSHSFDDFKQALRG